MEIKEIRIWPSGKPKRAYFDSGMVSCPKCKGRVDKKIYNSIICKQCGTTLRTVKAFRIIYSGKLEGETIYR